MFFVFRIEVHEIPELHILMTAISSPPPVSPLRFDKGEPRSAPPGVTRPPHIGSLPSDHSHAIIYKSSGDPNNRVGIFIGEEMSAHLIFLFYFFWF